MLRALIWDVDGTLAETEEDGHRPAFNAAFAESDLPWHWDSALYGRLLATTGGKERLLAWWREIDAGAAAAPGADALIRRLHERKTAHYLQRLDAGAIGLRPGVQPLIEAAATSGLVQAIATTTTADNVTRLLRLTLPPAAAAAFTVIGAGDVVAHKKPAPDVYRWVLQRLQLQPADCLAVEDSLPGVQSAQAAGVPVLLVRSRYTGDAPVAGCAADLPSLQGVGIDALRGWHAKIAALEQGAAPWT